MSSAYHLVITRYASAIIFIALVLAGVALSQLEKVRLDASSDSLLLQGDPDLASLRRRRSVTKVMNF
jgi:predicted RND superfamily exporter protein